LSLWEFTFFKLCILASYQEMKIHIGTGNCIQTMRIWHFRYFRFVTWPYCTANVLKLSHLLDIYFKQL